MRTRTSIVIVAALFALFLAVTNSSIISAKVDSAAPAHRFDDIQVVSYASGLTGFFDRSTGRLYLYGADLKTPFMVSEIQKLGEPLKVIKAPPG
jgi:hypothetical protein